MDYQTIYREVRAALDEKQAREAGLTPGDELPLFVELERYVRSIVPNVQSIYDALGPIQRIWDSNGVTEILAETKPEDVPLGQGAIPAAQWVALQRLFYALQLWIQTPVTLPNDPEGTKPGPIPLAVISQRPKTTTAK